ncbi:MAG: hypothetical protein JHC87_04455, partial [Thermoleophilaceae bacterium]|nr:hypothetical protein [Thermoleophilaceae bacterium]
NVPPPAAPAAGGAPSAGIERLAAPLGSVADDVFQPINEPDQLWFGMLAVLLAAGVIGAMREYEKP